MLDRAKVMYIQLLEDFRKYKEVSPQSAGSMG